MLIISYALHHDPFFAVQFFIFSIIILFFQQFLQRFMYMYMTYIYKCTIIIIINVLHKSSFLYKRTNMASLSKCSEKMKLLIGLLSLQLCFAGYHIVSRVALNIGVSKVVYPVYRNIIALLILAPIAFFLERYVRNFC